MYIPKLRLVLALLAVGLFSLTGCSDDDSGGPVCGNSLLEEGESCDTNELDGQTCTTMPGDYTGGTLACTSSCAFDTSGCTTGNEFCGNDVQEAGEQCDGPDLGGADCTDAGNFVGGTLGCTTACDYDTSGCTTGGDAVQQLIDARASADGSNLTLPIDGAWVTYVKAAVGTDPAGFFLQASVNGPALFVAVDPVTLTPPPAVGDAVILTVTTMATVAMMRQATEITGYSVASSGYDVTLLSQEVSSASDLVTAIDDYEVELISVTGTIAGQFEWAGTGHQAARFETASVIGEPDLRIRVPDALLPVVGLEQGCEVLVQHTPLWRYDAVAQISVWASADASLIACPAPVVLSASATLETEVVVTFSRGIEPTSVLADGSQFTFTNGLTASAAAVSGNQVTVTTSAQTPADPYTVTVAQTVTDILGSALAGPPDDQADFAGYVENLCGNGTTDAGEDCDDGNRDSYDGCSSTCHTEAAHLLISELVVTPTEGEYIELYNPTSAAVSLDDIYLSDFNTYYNVTQGAVSPSNNDFLVQFPAGHTIAAGGFVVVSVAAAAVFHTEYGMYPDFDTDASDANAPAMTGTLGNNAGLTNTSEMLVLFTWDGSSALVQDLDYVFWGNNTGAAMDKTTISTYLADTATTSQVSATAPAFGESLERCDTSEDGETDTGGNGLTGHDETSEDFSVSFVVSTSPTPGTAPVTATCNP